MSQKRSYQCDSCRSITRCVRQALGEGVCWPATLGEVLSEVTEVRIGPSFAVFIRLGNSSDQMHMPDRRSKLSGLKLADEGISRFRRTSWMSCCNAKLLDHRNHEWQAPERRRLLLGEPRRVGHST